MMSSLKRNTIPLNPGNHAISTVCDSAPQTYPRSPFKLPRTVFKFLSLVTHNSCKDGRDRANSFMNPVSQELTSLIFCATPGVSNFSTSRLFGANAKCLVFANRFASCCWISASCNLTVKSWKSTLITSMSNSMSMRNIKPSKTTSLIRSNLFMHSRMLSAYRFWNVGVEFLLMAFKVSKALAHLDTSTEDEVKAPRINDRLGGVIMSQADFTESRSIA
mmetsp:Transcript_14493/g.36699  ORF Transcript_14493/g.36699 Transcript_14493/m.36699 type:complete len:219 (+) Transcript_14493:974-1630(+)